MKNQELSRRDFLLRVTAFGALAAGSGTVLAACGGETEATKTTTAAPAPEKAPVASGCNDLTGLSDADKAMRTQLKYVEVSADASKHCNNCALYNAPEAGVTCGGCKIIKGPIAPKGYCMSWSPQST